MAKDSLKMRLQSARAELQDLKLKKSGRNTYSNFNYYELGDFLPAINILCQKHSMLTHFDLKPAGISDQPGMVATPETAILTIFDSESDEKITFISPTAEANIGRKKDGSGGADPIQNLGGKITYLRRYMLMTAFEMVENDMVDTVKRGIATELEQADIDKINEAKDFKELTEICGKLKTIYKASLIKPFYEKRKEELDNQVTRKTE